MHGWSGNGGGGDGQMQGAEGGGGLGEGGLLGRGGGGDGEGGGGSDGLGEGSGQLERRASRANEIMSRLEEEDEVFTMCSVEFVEYDEKLYRALVASGASNGRVELDDAKLGPL